MSEHTGTGLQADEKRVVDYREGDCISFLDPDGDLFGAHNRIYGVVTEVNKGQVGVLFYIDLGEGHFLRTTPDTLSECDVERLSPIAFAARLNAMTMAIRSHSRELMQTADKKL